MGPRVASGLHRPELNRPGLVSTAVRIAPFLVTCCFIMVAVRARQHWLRESSSVLYVQSMLWIISLNQDVSVCLLVIVLVILFNQPLLR